jgi:ABC-type uncharacterized transport system ATPase subunit
MVREALSGDHLGTSRTPSRRVRSVSIIEVSELQKRYGEKVAVSDVSFEVAEGEIFRILGPNGAGKTTTVECIAGLRERDGGRISVLGLDPGRDQGELREVLGMQLQESATPDKLRVREAPPPSPLPTIAACCRRGHAEDAPPLALHAHGAC